MRQLFLASVSQQRLDILLVSSGLYRRSNSTMVRRPVQPWPVKAAGKIALILKSSRTGPQCLTNLSKHSAQNHTANLSLGAFSRFHDSLVRSDKQTLSHSCHSLDVCRVMSTYDLLNIVTADPHSLRRLADHIHLPQNRLSIPILHAEP